MKKSILTALIAAAAIAPVAAQADSYVGVNVGRTQQKFNSAVLSAKDNSTAYKVYGGYQFTPYVGIEGGYNDLGTGEVKGIDGGKAKAKQIYVAATGTIPLGERFALTGKAGVASTRTTLSNVLGSDKYKHTGLMLGVGATYAITPTALAVVEYEDFGKTAKEDSFTMKAHVLSAGVRFKF